MRLDRTWADALIVVATANFLKRDILIVNSSPEAYSNPFHNIYGGEGDEQPLLLGHVWENHYQSLAIEGTACIFLKNHHAILSL